MDLTPAQILTHHTTLTNLDSLLPTLETDPLILGNSISNKFTPSTSPTPQYLPSYNPKTGKTFASVPISTAEDVSAAVSAAEAAFPAWAATPRAKRAEYLHRIAGLIREYREVFAVWESVDQGKTVERGRVEVDRAIANFT